MGCQAREIAQKWVKSNFAKLSHLDRSFHSFSTQLKFKQIEEVSYSFGGNLTLILFFEKFPAILYTVKKHGMEVWQCPISKCLLFMFLAATSSSRSDDVTPLACLSACLSVTLFF